MPQKKDEPRNNTSNSNFPLFAEMGDSTIGNSFMDYLGKALGVDPEAANVVGYFLEAWANSDFGGAYDWLASDSPLREGLTRDAWIEQRTSWSRSAQSEDLKISFLEPDLAEDEFDEDGEEDEAFEEEENDENEGGDDGPVSVQVGWSLRMSDEAMSKGSHLSELPQATIMLKETGRHWFWSSYSVVGEEDEWRIQSMVDEGANTLQLPTDELRQLLDETTELAGKQLQHLEAEAEELEGEDFEDEDDEDEDDDDIDEEEDLAFASLMDRLSEAIQVTTRSMHYTDALFAKGEIDFTLYKQAYSAASVVEDNERAAAYAQLAAKHLPEQRGEALRDLAMAYMGVGQDYDPETESEQAERYSSLVEQSLREAVAVDNTPISRILLARTLVELDRSVNEAEELLQQTQPLTNDVKELTLIEASFAIIAQKRGKLEDALGHYQKAAKLSSDFPGIWNSIGAVQLQLKRDKEAEKNFKRSTEVDPGLTDAYISLATIYMNRNDLTKARKTLEDGLDHNPDAAELLATLAIIHTEQGDFKGARDLLEEAEEIDEESPYVEKARDFYDERLAARNQKRRSSNKKAAQKPKRKR